MHAKKEESTLIANEKNNTIEAHMKYAELYEVPVDISLRKVSKHMLILVSYNHRRNLVASNSCAYLLESLQYL